MKKKNTPLLKMSFITLLFTVYERLIDSIAHTHHRHSIGAQSILPRLHLFEWHDQAFFPQMWRTLLTQVLEESWKTMKYFELGSPLIMEAVNRQLPKEEDTNTINTTNTATTKTHTHHNAQVVDLCSGSGGPWKEMQKELAFEYGVDVDVTLTDLYPQQTHEDEQKDTLNEQVQKERREEIELRNKKVFTPTPMLTKKENGEKRETKSTHTPEYTMKYADESVNAMACERKGVRTMFASMHHFRSKEAARILKNAQETRQPIVVFEATERSVWTCILITIAMIIMGFITPIAKAIRKQNVSISQLFWTFVIPIVPFVTSFDGFISTLRTYSPHEMAELIDSFQENDDEGALKWINYSKGRSDRYLEKKAQNWTWKTGVRQFNDWRFFCLAWYTPLAIQHSKIKFGYCKSYL